MGGFLRQSTQADRRIGPFLDKTDGVTEETGLAGAGTEVSKEGAAFGAGPVLGTHDSDGWYPITLTTTHTNTVGELAVKVHDAATHLPVWVHFTVLEEAVYDAIFAASAAGYGTAQTGDSFARLGAPAGASHAADILVIDNLVDDLESRLTAARAGFLDNINNATLAAAVFPTDPADHSTVIAATDAILAAVGDVPTNAELATSQAAADDATLAAIAALNNLSAAQVRTELTTELGRIDAAVSTRATPAQVNVEVLDVLNVDTFAQPGQEAPAATTTLGLMLRYLYKMMRNKKEQTSSAFKLYDDAGTVVDQKSTVSDDTVTATSGELGTGP